MRPHASDADPNHAHLAGVAQLRGRLSAQPFRAQVDLAATDPPGARGLIARRGHAASRSSDHAAARDPGRHRLGRMDARRESYEGFAVDRYEVGHRTYGHDAAQRPGLGGRR